MMILAMRTASWRRVSGLLLPKTRLAVPLQYMARGNRLTQLQLRSFNSVVSDLLQDKKDDESQDDRPNNGGDDKREKYKLLKVFLSKCAEAGGITFCSVAILGFAGILYHRFYYQHVLDKMDETFDADSPSSSLVLQNRKYNETSDSEIDELWVERPQQQKIDDIISGKIQGQYFLLVGEKGTGKTSLILESIRKVNGSNVAMFDAHADPEIFRLRLGKALNFSFNEDYIGLLFSIRGPRETTALLDIERAFSKLEEVAIRRVDRVKSPLVIIINSAHLIKENEEGIKLLELLQQKAENLSGSNLATIVFNSDDYWVYEKLKKLGTRMELINVRDFSRADLVKALQYVRQRYFRSEPDQALSEKQCHQVYNWIGGRPQHISQVARHRDIETACHQIIDREKTWLLNMCGLLGRDMDDDVLEYGKFSTSAMLLAREFVEMDRNRIMRAESLTADDDEKVTYGDHILPELPLWRSRQIMTRPDYIRRYDDLNIFTLDSYSRVRADLVPMMRAFHEVALQPHFDDLLSESLGRVSEIEALGRTRELVAKDLCLGSKYVLAPNRHGGFDLSLQLSARTQSLHGGEEGDEDDDGSEGHLILENIGATDKRKLWNQRFGFGTAPATGSSKD